jgi:hypothetical protein
MRTKFWSESLKGESGRILLKWIIKQHAVRAKTGLN